MSDAEDRGFGWLLVAVSAAFALILWPLAGAILWGTVLAIVFAPLARRLAPLLGRSRAAAALATLVIVLVMVIVPLVLLAAALGGEASDVYARVRSGDVDVGGSLRRFADGLPAWAHAVLDRLDLGDAAAVQERLSGSLASVSKFFATQAISLGQNTLDFLVGLGVMLYLLFFLLRDGERLFARMRSALPLRADRQRALFDKFAVVVRATVKGNIVVAIAQGALGGLIFWLLGIRAPLLLGVLMALLSLLPAVGAAIVWLPVALYLLAAGPAWKGLVLIAWGVLVIGLVDNLLRPILVGKDTRMPDYVVLVSTLGGIAVFGLNGFVIGPLIAAMFIAAWDLYAASRR